MAHTLIVGKTMSGKTILSQKMCKAYKANGIASIVLDPLADPEWQADFVTSNKEKFLDVVWQSRQCAIFIDESGDMIGKYDEVMNMLATRGRHWGHRCHFITQRAKQISPTIRTQCTQAAIFKQSLADTKDLANEFVEPMINEAHTLQKGEFIWIGENSMPQKINVFSL